MSSQSLTVAMLGEFHVRYGETSVTDALTPRLQSLLAYLLLHRDMGPSRQQMAFHFWPNSTERQARTNLRKTVYRLRQAFPEVETFLDLDSATFSWRMDAPLSLDVAHFEAGLQELESAPEQQQPQRLEAVLALYRGPLLPGLYDDWVLPMREQLRQRYLDGLDYLAELQEAQRDYAAAGHTARTILREAPLRERGYRRLMRLQALNGDVAAALRTYQDCAALLMKELGVEPAPATQAAYERLRNYRPPPQQTGAGPLRRQLPLVGRHEPWRALRASWNAAVTRSAQVVLISGEAGIGKTRLAEELLFWARAQGFVALPAACYAAENQLPFAAVADWLRAEPLQQALSVLAPRWRSEVARVLPELLAANRDLEMPRPMTEPWQKHHLFMALAEAVCAAGAPLLLLLEDLHWADANTLAWLHFFLRQKTDARLLLLATIRSDELAPDHRLQQWQRELENIVDVRHVVLPPLDAGATAALAAQLVGAELEPSRSEALYQATEGNPLFTVEMARAGLQGAGTALPARIRSVIELRLSRLTPSARELLGIAALIGRSFTLPLLAAASHLSAEGIVRGLDELCQRQMIREQGQDGYDFSHDLIRQVALAQLSAARQRWGHHRVAQALENAYASDLDPVHGQIAAHWAAAGDRPKAAHHYIQAAASASRLFAHRESVHHLQRALALLPADHPRRSEIHASRGESFLLLGDVDQSAAAFSDAAHATADPLRKTSLLSRRVRALSVPGRLAQARDAYHAALAILERMPVVEWDVVIWRLWLDLHLNACMAFYFGNETDEMARITQEMAEPLEAHGTARQRAHYFASLGNMRYRTLRYKLTVKDLVARQTALRWARQTADESLIGLQQFGLGFSLLWAGQLAEAVVELQQAAALATHHGNVPVQCRCLTYLSIGYRFQGDQAAVRSTVQEFLPLARSTDDRNYLGVAEAHQGWLALRGADNIAAEAHSRAALQYWRSTESPYPMQWLAYFPLLAMALEDAVDAGAAQEHARAMLVPPQQQLPTPLNDALETAVAAENHAATAAHLQEACRLAREYGHL